MVLTLPHHQSSSRHSIDIRSHHQISSTRTRIQAFLQSQSAKLISCMLRHLYLRATKTGWRVEISSTNLSLRFGHPPVHHFLDCSLDASSIILIARPEYWTSDRHQSWMLENVSSKLPISIDTFIYTHSQSTKHDAYESSSMSIVPRLKRKPKVRVM